MAAAKFAAEAKKSPCGIAILKYGNNDNVR